jgi:hypothetical protein
MRQEAVYCGTASAQRVKTDATSLHLLISMHSSLPGELSANTNISENQKHTTNCPSVELQDKAACVLMQVYVVVVSSQYV